MTRRHGVVDSAAGLVPFGHLGWGYRDRDEFRRRAAEYIADGLAERQWVEFVGDGSREELRAELAAVLAGGPGPTDADRITVTPALEFYGVTDGDVVDPEVAVATRVAAVEQAMAAGYTGFRAVVDATAVTRRPEQRDTFARFEFLIDQKMAALPVSALCAYDLGELGEHARGLVCLHPLVGPAAPDFRVYAQPGTALVFDGEIDAADARAFTEVVDRVLRHLPPAAETVVDVSELCYMDRHQLQALDEAARADGRRIVLRGGATILTRLADLLDLTNIVVEPRKLGADSTPR